MGDSNPFLLFNGKQADVKNVGVNNIWLKKGGKNDYKRCRRTSFRGVCLVVQNSVMSARFELNFPPMVMEQKSENEWVRLIEYRKYN